MKIFIAASYASKVNYETGEVLPEYKVWLENIIGIIEELGHTVFCALRADQYKINNASPAEAFSLDMKHIRESDCVLALVGNKASTGVQTEIGVAVALGKMLLIAHTSEDKLAYFNAAMIKAGVAQEIELPFNKNKLKKVLVS